jgi:GDP/UDP-N,N'-diacetylbacillosamine 2-epimerase (hydrolysing)
MPGADIGNRLIEKEIKKFVSKNKNSYFYKSLGQKNYFSFLKYIDVMIGNSSSGILEMPYFKKATINLGNRQLGRLISKSVINIPIKKNKISNALKKALSRKFKKKIKNKKTFYGKPGASQKIVKILKKINKKIIFQKKFYDI